MFRIASWNVNSLRVRLPHVQQWLEKEQPDILALQETKVTDENFPLEAFTEMGYSAAYNGQKTFNGVATVSKTEPEIIATAITGLEDPQKRLLATRIRGITILNLYVPNGSAVGSDKYQYKLDWFGRLHPFVRKLLRVNGKMIILGDFNVAPEDRDVHDPAAWEGGVLVSEPERRELQTLLKIGFSDCFRLFEQEENSFTWWDYRAAAFRRNHGLRIDLILASKALQPHCTGSRIDLEPRKLERPSDHAPVIAEFDI